MNIIKNPEHKYIGCNEIFKDKEITSQMSKLIDETYKDHFERFFKFCAKDNKIRATEHYIGEEIGVIPSADCNKDEDTIGWFHTHPKPGDERLSVSDALYGIDKNFSCVGFKKTRKNKVLCFKSPYGIPPNKSIETEDIFSFIDNIMKKKLNLDCDEIV